MKGHLRKRKNQNGYSWQVVVDVGGSSSSTRKRIYKTVNGNKKEAEKVLLNLLNDLENGLLIDESRITLQQYLSTWLEEHVKSNLAPSTYDGYRVNIENHIKPALGNIRLQDLKPLLIQQFINRLYTEKKLSPQTIRVVFQHLHNALKHAVRLRLLKLNPADGIVLPKRQKFHGEVYNEDEIISLLKNVQGTTLEIPVTLAAVLGLRRGEILALKWSDINWESQQIKICRSLIHCSEGYQLVSPKTESGHRTLDAPSGLMEQLRKHKVQQNKDKLYYGSVYQDQDLVCCNSIGGFRDPGGLSSSFKKFLNKERLKLIRFHDLRHSNATLMLKFGTPAKIASVRLGHSTIGITMDLYSHVLDGMQQGTAEMIDNRLYGRVKENEVWYQAG